MRDQQHHDRGMAENRTDFQVLEALADAGLERQSIEKGLKDDESTERGQLLVLEAELGQRTDFPVNLGPSMLDPGSRLSGLVGVSQHNHTRVEAVVSFDTKHFLTLAQGECRRTAKTHTSRRNYRLTRTRGSEDMHLAGQ